MDSTIAFDQIYFPSNKEIQKNSFGKLKFAAAGLGWKESSSGQVVTEKIQDIKGFQWIRSARGFQLRIELLNENWCVFDGFSSDAMEGLAEFVRKNYKMAITVDDICGKGWNWGRVEITKEKELKFMVSGKLAFEVPLKEASNALVGNANELVVEFGNNGANIYPTNDKDDVVSEIRFYIPSGKEEKEKDDEAEDDEAELEERLDEGMEEESESLDDQEENLAETLLGQIKAVSSFSKISGDVIASLPELVCTVPRGRYNFDMFSSFLRLYGKSYDYKINYSSIIKLFLLPKPDDVHIILVLALDPPIRQGQTHYPFIIVQFPKDEKIEEFQLENVTEEELKGKYDGKLQMAYHDIATFELVSMLFRTLADQKVVVPGSGFKSIYGGASCIKCAYKANEGLLYPLERNFLFLTKPVILIPHADVAHVTFSRVILSSGLGNPRSFDLKIGLKAGSTPEHVFTNLNKDEYENLVSYFKLKDLPFSIESGEGRVRLQQSEDSEDDDEFIVKSDEEGSGRRDGRRKKIKSSELRDVEEEEESTDEDYVEGGSEEESEESNGGSDDYDSEDKDNEMDLDSDE